MHIFKLVAENVSFCDFVYCFSPSRNSDNILLNYKFKNWSEKTLNVCRQSIVNEVILQLNT